MRKLFISILTAIALVGCSTTHELKSPCVAAGNSPCETREVNKPWT
jgi:uncharacterized protein YceK